MASTQYASSARTEPAQALGASAIAFLRRYPPFDEMAEPLLRLIGSKMTLAYYPKGAVILAPSDGEPRFLYIVYRGAVAETSEQRLAAPTVREAGDCFPIHALLEHRATTSTWTAQSDTFCYQLPADAFAVLLDGSARFREFATGYLSSLLRDSRRLLKMHLSAHAGEEQAAHRPLRSLIQRPAVTCTPDTPIGDALRAMERARIGSILIVENDGTLAGILTRHDVLDRIALARRDLNEPVSHVMTASPTTLPADATTYEAALLIARKGFRHVPVKDGEAIIGVVTERDLFALQHVTMRAIRRTIENAEDAPALQSATRDIRALAGNMVEQGLGAEQLTYIVSTLNDALTERIIALECRRHDLEGLEWCWLAFGSEGRFEQTISTDQDNGIIFGDDPALATEYVRARLLPFAAAVNRTLDACGFPLCRGNVMAGNPRWCLSLKEWRARFESWVNVSSPQQLLDAVIFFDFRPLCGAEKLATDLRECLSGLVRAKPLFLRMLAQQALESAPPFGLLGGFAVDDEHPDAPGTIDLKASGARIFVDAARVFALATGVPHTNTAQRLRHGGARLNLSSDEIESATDAFFFVQLLRLRTQLPGVERPERMTPNRINPEELNEVDRRILKESFRQARRLQKRLALDYRL
jgi:CBS domain-containing protein